MRTLDFIRHVHLDSKSELWKDCPNLDIMSYSLKRNYYWKTNFLARINGNGYGGGQEVLYRKRLSGNYNQTTYSIGGNGTSTKMDVYRTRQDYLAYE
jgi:hypothetical protein